MKKCRKNEVEMKLKVILYVFWLLDTKKLQKSEPRECNFKLKMSQNGKNLAIKVQDRVKYQLNMKFHYHFQAKKSKIFQNNSTLDSI